MELQARLGSICHQMAIRVWSAGQEGRNGDYQVLFNFTAPVFVNGASVAPALGKSAKAAGFLITSADQTQVAVNLTNVTNAQTLSITLHGVSDGIAKADMAVRMSVLVGDTTGNGNVNSSDVSLTKLKSGQVVDTSNFRTDVSCNGSINSSDVSTVKLNSGTALP